jgi:type 1 glutamine amidotransferase
LPAQRKNVHLVCGGKYHDIDFVRLELLKLLAGFEHVRTTLAPDYADVDALGQADLLLTYTSDVMPGAAQLAALQAFMRRGGRWFALHGTNARLEYRKGHGWAAPPEPKALFDMLGSQFVAHPPIQPFTVAPSKPHPLTEGIEPFEADDEIYLCRFTADVECLLETHFSGDAPGFEQRDWQANGRVPVMYLHRWEGHELLYLNLGHARGHYDMQPMMDYYEHTERGSWKQPAFYELLRRGIRWSLGEFKAQSGEQHAG